jgi:membrane protein
VGAIRTFGDLLWDAFAAWSDDQAARLGAALAYYTVFSLAPLLVVILAVVDLAWGQQSAAVQAQMLGEIEAVIGADGAGVVRSMLEHRSLQAASSTTALVVSGLVVLMGATGVVVQLQDALNTIWGVTPGTEGGLGRLVRSRLLSFGLILFGGLLMLALLVGSTVVAVAGAAATAVIPAAEGLLPVADFGLSLLLLTLFFAVLFRQLPDAAVAWRDALVGAAFTALLFALGKAALSWYFGYASVASAYGAAGSFVVLLLWIYYSALILLFGAEFTQVYARQVGAAIHPADSAEPTDAETSPPALPEAESETSTGWGTRLALIALGWIVGRYFGSGD